MKYHIKRPNDRFGLKAKERNHHRHILPVGKRFRKCEPQGEGKGKREKGGRKSQKSHISDNKCNKKDNTLIYNNLYKIPNST